MSYRSILAYVDAEPESAVRYPIAAELAARTGGVLEGVFVRPPLIPAPLPVAGVEYVPPSTWETLVESHQAIVAQAEETARTRFQAAVEEAGCRAEWSAIEESAIWGFVGLARCSDLVVFPMSGMKTPHLPAMELAQESAAPLVLVPAAPASSRVGRKVLVAWNGSREAASALRGAWPILESADRVDLLMVEPSPEAEAFIDKHVKRHKVEARLHIYREADAGVGEMIRDHAEDLRADLVVMGLYGHSRLRELVLGGATRTMLNQETFPLLVSR